MSQEHHNKHWARVSKQVLAQYPLCQDPFGYHAHTKSYAPSVCVHHIKDVKNHPEEMFKSDNLLALCQQCHDALHAKRDALQAILASGVDAQVIAQAVATGGKLRVDSAGSAPRREGGCFNFRSRGGNQALESSIECTNF